MGTNAISTLLSLGNDATKNMFDVYYTPGGDDAKEVQLSGRLTGFTPPQWTIEKHDNSYHGHTISLPSTKVNFERKLELEFRLDANYEYYKFWRTLAQYAGNACTGGVANAPLNTGILHVVAIKDNIMGAGGDKAPAYYGDPLSGGSHKKDDKNSGSNQVDDHEVARWSFYNCWVAETSEPEFSTESGDVQTFKVTLYFGHCAYPYSQTNAEAGGIPTGNESGKSEGGQ